LKEHTNIPTRPHPLEKTSSSKGSYWLEVEMRLHQETDDYTGKSLTRN